jgi:hypothetical protein
MATNPNTGTIGFVFEGLIERSLNKLIGPLLAAGYKATLLGEQAIRDTFNEQSLNGVDHLFELQDMSGNYTHFLMQEKWKIMTNQREVSQFLDCCARIISRISPEKRGKIYRLWVTRSQPSLNGEKSLEEGGAYVIQSMTSQAFLAQMVGQFICEILGDRTLAHEMIASMPSLLPVEEPTAPEVLDTSKTAPIPTIGYKTQVSVRKV